MDKLMNILKEKGYIFKTMNMPVTFVDTDAGDKIPVEANLKIEGDIIDIVSTLEEDLEYKYVTIFPYKYENNIFRFGAIYKDSFREQIEGRT